MEKRYVFRKVTANSFLMRRVHVHFHRSPDIKLKRNFQVTSFHCYVVDFSLIDLMKIIFYEIYFSQPLCAIILYYGKNASADRDTAFVCRIVNITLSPTWWCPLILLRDYIYENSYTHAVVEICMVRSYTPHSVLSHLMALRRHPAFSAFQYSCSRWQFQV